MGSLLRSTRAVGAAALFSCVGALAALGGTSQASVSPAGSLTSFKPGHARYDLGIESSVTPSAISRVAASSTTFPHFQSSVTDGSTTYSYVMVGKNPAVQVSSPASTITADLVPVVIKFANGDVWDPTVKDSCDSGASALVRVQKSPLFVSQSWTLGGTAVGTGEVTDVFQRANFWSYAQPTGVNPSYAVNLTLKTLPKVIVNVPSTDAATSKIACGNKLLAGVKASWLQNYLQTKLIPSLASEGVNSSTLPVFVTHNVVEYVKTTSNCCVLGFHAAYKATSTSPVQTYAIGMYDNSKDFSGSSDISALSHELAEWMDDPYGTNPTPAWGHVGQVAGCQSTLEVGDPLSGTTFPDTVNSFTYHPQELAFFSWFFHEVPSIGVNGWYSDQGTFTSPAAACS
jgi:hypothetical protein